MPQNAPRALGWQGSRTVLGWQPHGASDGTSSVLCVGVGVCAGLAGQPNGAWMLVAVSGGGATRSPPTPPPPGRPSVCVGRGPTQCALEGPPPVCVRKRTWKKYVQDFFFQKQRHRKRYQTMFLFIITVPSCFSLWILDFGFFKKKQRHRKRYQTMYIFIVTVPSCFSLCF